MAVEDTTAYCCMHLPHENRLPASVAALAEMVGASETPKLSNDCTRDPKDNIPNASFVMRRPQLAYTLPPGRPELTPTEPESRMLSVQHSFHMHSPVAAPELAQHTGPHTTHSLLQAMGQADGHKVDHRARG